jgi:hypothetical protein
MRTALPAAEAITGVPAEAVLGRPVSNRTREVVRHSSSSCRLCRGGSRRRHPGVDDPKQAKALLHLLIRELRMNRRPEIQASSRPRNRGSRDSRSSGRNLAVHKPARLTEWLGCRTVVIRPIEGLAALGRAPSKRSVRRPAPTARPSEPCGNGAAPDRCTRHLRGMCRSSCVSLRS